MPGPTPPGAGEDRTLFSDRAEGLLKRKHGKIPEAPKPKKRKIEAPPAISRPPARGRVVEDAVDDDVAHDL